jgi:prepilin-type N-terminal cleavage/methylation domain-containing protein
MKIYSKKINRESGFTLIELIASLVIFALMFTLAGMGIVMAAKGYVITKESAHMAQKAQLAMARINREILEITDIAAAVVTPPDPYIIYDHVDGRKAIAKGGSTIKMFFNLGPAQTTLPAFSDGDILIDDVTQFTLTYYKSDSTAWVFGTDDIKELSSVGVEIVMSRADSGVGDKTFSTTVRPRNTGR